MRGSDQSTGSLFSYVDLEERVPARDPLRKIKAVVDAALATLDADFERLYAGEGRPSIAPERLMRASLVQNLFLIRWDAVDGAVAVQSHSAGLSGCRSTSPCGFRRSSPRTATVC